VTTPTIDAATLVNGVNTGAIGAFVGQLQAGAPGGGTPFSATVLWKDGFRNEIRIRDLEPHYADEPTVLGGTNTASNPVEQILGALGACLAIGYTANASVRGIDLRGLEIDLTGRIDLPVFFGLKDGHAGFPDIEVRVHLDADAPQEELEALHAHVIRTSPVGNTLQRPVTIAAVLV
jgi:uncharacterized OsmC-like protein